MGHPDLLYPLEKISSPYRDLSVQPKNDIYYDSTNSCLGSKERDIFGNGTLDGWAILLNHG
jgi:hypothetical protein